MAGILDSKSRIIDAILTAEGRRQMAAGTFEISHVTFSDATVAYVPDSIDGHIDPTTRIYLEACDLPQDQITFEANDEGKLVAFRSQDIKLATPQGNVPSSMAEGTLVNGRLTVYQYHHGRRIKAPTIAEDPTDDGKGFVYSDSTNLTGSVLVSPTLRGVGVPSGPPYKVQVGTRGGLGPQEFAKLLSGAIAALRDFGGPDVSASAVNDSVYLDIGTGLVGSTIFSTGTLSSPLLIEAAAVGGNLMVDELENAAFASQIQGILTSSFDNFSDLRTISTIDRLFEDDSFELSKNEITFDMSDVPAESLKSFKDAPPSLTAMDSMFNDDKLSHLENFMYLPPIVKTSDSLVTDKTKLENLTPHLLGDYPSWGDNEKRLTFARLQDQLRPYDGVHEQVNFRATSLRNNVVAQFFEVTDRHVSKLDVVDFGDVMNDAQSSTTVTNRVFFVGKTYLDNRGTTVFVNMFTLVFSKIPADQEGLK